MSGMLHAYYLKLLESFEARDSREEEREDHVLADLDRLWLSMPAAEKEACNVVSDFALATHDGNVLEIMSLMERHPFLAQVIPATSIAAHTIAREHLYASYRLLGSKHGHDHTIMRVTGNMSWTEAATQVVSAFHWHGMQTRHNDLYRASDCMSQYAHAS